MRFESNYDNISQYFGVLSKSVFVTNPAEIHGTLAGIICMNSSKSEKSWFNTILKTLETRVGLASKEKSEVMLDLYDKTYRQLLGVNDDFHLLLPGDDHSLEERATALNSWCRGFMYALRFADVRFEENLTEDGLLALGSIFNLANLDMSQIKFQDQDYDLFFGAIRYIQNSVVILYDELRDESTKQKIKIPKDKYLH